MTVTTRRLIVTLLLPAMLCCACNDAERKNTAPTATTTASGSSPTASADRNSRGAPVATPSISGPIIGGDRGTPFNAMATTLADQWGYIEEEYFLDGIATSYTTTGTPSSNGAWTVLATSTAPYVTRVLVRRPIDLTSFDGTVLVEWLNVSSGQDSDVDFAQVHAELMSHGSAWVGVSAQSVGVLGGTSMSMPGLDPKPLKAWDPLRYAGLAHPGDDFSYDIFSQTGAALVRTDGVGLLGGAPVRSLIATGESQSAARLVTYVNAVHPITNVYDGFLIHSRGNGGAALEIGTTLPVPARIRDDLDVPVFQFETESDILGLGFIDARQPDSTLLRTWEVPGTSHLDRALLNYLRSPPRVATSVPDPVEDQCGLVNDGPQAAVLSKAMASLRSWIGDEKAPSNGPPIEVRDGAIVRDEVGNALGGIRSPAVDAPLAVLRGDNPTRGGYACSLFGSKAPLDHATLAARYATPERYVAAVRRSAEAAVRDGFLLEADAQRYVDEARNVVPFA